MTCFGDQLRLDSDLLVKLSPRTLTLEMILSSGSSPEPVVPETGVKPRSSAMRVTGCRFA